MPLSIFLGRPLPGPGEPLWLADDTEKALAYEAAQSEICSGCGFHPDDWKDAEGHPYSPPLYEPVARHCELCAEKTRLMLDIESSVRNSTDSKPETAARATAGLSVTFAPFKPEGVE